MNLPILILMLTINIPPLFYYFCQIKPLPRVNWTQEGVGWWVIRSLPLLSLSRLGRGKCDYVVEIDLENQLKLDWHFKEEYLIGLLERKCMTFCLHTHRRQRTLPWGQSHSMTMWTEFVFTFYCLYLPTCHYCIGEMGNIYFIGLNK